MARETLETRGPSIIEELGPEMPRLLERQRANVEGAKRLLQVAQNDPYSFETAVDAAKKALEIQLGSGLSGESPTGLVSPEADSPSTVALALAQSRGVSLSSSEREAIMSLDELDEPVRQALSGILGAFGLFSRSAVAMDPQTLAESRSALLDGVVDLQLSLATSPQVAAAPVEVADLISINLDMTDDQYAGHFALQIDAGGSDTYLNNAGGNNLSSTCVPGNPAGALIDLSGDDAYTSDKACGINGGGMGGAGFLVDVKGRDVYRAGGSGVNGGGDSSGSGFLLDGAGDDSYSGGDLGINGGANNAAAGLLVDVGGVDVYNAGLGGVNGAGSVNGTGFLADFAGADRYSGAALGVNGGGRGQGVGFLFDRHGDDAYSAGSQGINGGGSTTSAGFLYDGEGDDDYLTADLGTNGGGTNVATGLLIDQSGNDEYLAGRRGVNGGGAQGAGILVDSGGNDRYTAECCGANGGAFLGSGALVDATGDDHYVATELGTNGGSELGPALLLDGCGTDFYTENATGTQQDATVVPKGTIEFAQIAGQIDSPCKGTPTSGLSIDDTVAPEGTSAALPATEFIFTVTLSPARSEPVSVKYFASNGTANASDDFSAVNGSLDFLPGEYEKQITVPVSADSGPERDEFFSVFLTENENSVVAKGQGIGVIKDDDGGTAPPALTVTDVVQEEGSGNVVTNYDFKVTLTSPSGNQPVTLKFITANGTAEGDKDDFKPVSNSLTFAPGETQKTIRIEVAGDDGAENTEFFNLYLMDAVNAVTLKNHAVGVIVNDDGNPISIL